MGNYKKEKKKGKGKERRKKGGEKKARQRLGRKGRTGIIFEFGKQDLTHSPSKLKPDVIAVEKRTNGLKLQAPSIPPGWLLGCATCWLSWLQGLQQGSSGSLISSISMFDPPFST